MVYFVAQGCVIPKKKFFNLIVESYWVIEGYVNMYFLVKMSFLECE